MKTIGLIGGMSWESTVSYYQLINRGIQQRLGGLHSAKICLQSVDFAPIEKLQKLGDWTSMAEILVHAGRAVEAGGADCLLICTNTMHKVSAAVANAVNIPLLHIADATGRCLVDDGISKVALLGTRFTMEEGFYKDRLIENFLLDVLVPTEPQRQMVHDIIYRELCLGKINPKSRAVYLAIIDELSSRGAQAVILGCTEIALLIEPTHTSFALYDTTSIHAAAAVEFALSNN